MKPQVLEGILVKSEDETDPKYGRNPEERGIEEYIRNGIVNIDKPSGPNSHQVAAWVRDLLGLKKSGHSGTLDPKVTGVLPIALEDATKIVKALLLSEKEYVCLMSMHDKASDEAVGKAFTSFQGPIFQTPPIKSAVKRELRIRNIYEIKNLERADQEILFKVRCESGTYIRKLCHDIGLVLCTGAHMHQLRRTKTGPFDESTLVKLQDLKDAYSYYKENGDETSLRKAIQPVESGVADLKKIWLKDGAISAICHGADLNAPGVSRLEKGIHEKQQVALMSLKDELVAVARTQASSQQIYEAKKGVVATLERVYMNPETYPKKWHTKQKNENI